MPDKLLEARIEDTFLICERTCVPKFLGFLNEFEAQTATEILNKKNSRYSFFGGYEGAQRRMLCCMPDWCEKPDFPIKAFTFSYRSCDKLTHRDFLGALMSLGIKRESVGDILIESARAVVFVSEGVADFVETQLFKVANYGVSISKGFDLPLPQESKKIQESSTVASLRLDCIVSTLCNISRGKAAELIENCMVSVNSLGCQKVSKILSQGDKVTVRGKGKFEIALVNGLSKKGRIIIEYTKYI